LQGARVRGRQSVDDLVDRHQLRNREVRDLLVDYIRRRAVEVDYGTLDNLVRNLVRYFWKIVEEINPDQADLRLSEGIVQAWKERLLVRQDGKPRQHIDGPFLAVRAFYLDLQTWSAAEPERWSRWVAPCPIRDADLRWFHIRRRRLQERMANRTRERQPLLAILSEHVTTEWHRLRTRSRSRALRNASPCPSAAPIAQPRLRNPQRRLRKPAAPGDLRRSQCARATGLLRRRSPGRSALLSSARPWWLRMPSPTPAQRSSGACSRPPTRPAGGTCAQFKTLGIHVTRITESFTVGMPSEAESTTLRIGKAVPVLRFTAVTSPTTGESQRSRTRWCGAVTPPSPTSPSTSRPEPARQHPITSASAEVTGRCRAGSGQPQPCCAPGSPPAWPAEPADVPAAVTGLHQPAADTSVLSNWLRASLAARSHFQVGSLCRAASSAATPRR
jgi:hypothetical protein